MHFQVVAWVCTDQLCHLGKHWGLVSADNQYSLSWIRIWPKVFTGIVSKHTDVFRLLHAELCIGHCDFWARSLVISMSLLAPNYIRDTVALIMHQNHTQSQTSPGSHNSNTNLTAMVFWRSASGPRTAHTGWHKVRKSVASYGAVSLQ